MAIYVFDTSEFISLIAAFIGLLVIAYLYFFRHAKRNKSFNKSSVQLMFLIFLFVFFNRFFTNVEALAYKSFFNLLEHLSSLAASCIAVVFSWKGIEGWSKSATK